MSRFVHTCIVQSKCFLSMKVIRITNGCLLMHPSDFWTRYNVVNMMVTKLSFLQKVLLFLSSHIDVIFWSSTGKETTVRAQHCEPSGVHEQGKFVSISSSLLCGPSGVFLVKKIAPL